MLSNRKPLDAIITANMEQQTAPPEKRLSKKAAIIIGILAALLLISIPLNVWQLSIQRETAELLQKAQSAAQKAADQYGQIKDYAIGYKRQYDEKVEDADSLQARMTAEQQLKAYWQKLAQNKTLPAVYLRPETPKAVFDSATTAAGLATANRLDAATVAIDSLALTLGQRDEEIATMGVQYDSLFNGVGAIALKALDNASAGGLFAGKRKRQNREIAKDALNLLKKPRAKGLRK